MRTPDCERWMNEPDSLEAHPRSCASCAAVEAELEGVDRVIEQTTAQPAGSLAPLLTERLPVAPWEGSHSRSWSLAIIALLAIAGAGALLFALVGISPLEGLVGSMRGLAAQQRALFGVGESMGSFLRSAPAGFHVLIAAAVILVNLVLFLMLRRGPRGYDVRSR